MSDTGSVSIPFEPGEPSRQRLVPLSVPEIRGNEWKYIKECLDTNWVSSVGPFVGRFERLVADYVGARFAVATVSGTAALHLALLAAGVAPDDEVLVPALTFVATANAVRYAGAWPVFMDIDPAYRQIDTEKTVEFLKTRCRWRDGALYNKTTDRRVRAVLPVHLLGHPVDMDPINEAAGDYGLAVIEDAAESLGARYLSKRPTGEGEWLTVGRLGGIACFSFNGNKVITTGGGGMVVTDNQAWAEKVRYLATQAKDDAVEYRHSEIGYNYRLTNIQAAMGVAQMEALDQHIEAKLRIAERYREGLAGVGGIALPDQATWARSIFWLYTVLVDPDVYGIDSRTLLRRLREAGIESRPFWQPLHRLPPYRTCEAYRIEAAVGLYRDGLSLPSSVSLEPKDQDRVITAIGKLGRA